MSVPPALVIVGGGADAAFAYGIVAAADPDGAQRFVGFLDDAGGSSSYPAAAPVSCIGRVRTLVTLDPDVAFVLAPGSPASRRIASTWALARGRSAASVAHPTARLEGRVGPGHLVGARAHVAPGATVGEQVHLGEDVVIGAATVGSFATIGARSEVADGVVLAEEVVLGRDVRVAPGVRIGARSVVHDGALVLADLPADARVLSPSLAPV